MTPDNGPTAERARRSAFLSAPAIGTEQEPARAGARMYRALSTIERLRRDGSITARQAEAGERIRIDYELGIAGARDAAQGSSSAFGWYYADARLRALESYQSAATALGRTAAFVLPICISEISLSQLARLQRLNRQEVTGIVKLGLTILADHYDLAPEA